MPGLPFAWLAWPSVIITAHASSCTPPPSLPPSQDHGGSAPRLREVAKGTGACCGASALDARFLRRLAERVPVFEEFRRRHPADAMRLLLHTWEHQKRSYAGDGPCVVELPAPLVQMWGRHRAAFYAEAAGAEARWWWCRLLPFSSRPSAFCFVFFFILSRLYSACCW